MKTTRLSFVRGSFGVCTAGLLAAACGGDDDDDDGGGGEGTGVCGAAIGTNHGHDMSVSAADKMAGVDKTYSIQGSSSHNHTVEVSADDFAELAAGTIVILTSSTDAGHSHDVTITC